jgi:hypothetical protein
MFEYLGVLISVIPGLALTLLANRAGRRRRFDEQPAEGSVLTNAGTPRVEANEIGERRHCG